MPRWVALLTCLLLVGCSSATRSVVPATGQTRYCVNVPSSDFEQEEQGGALAAVPATGAGSPTAPLRPSPPPLRGLPGGGAGDGVPRGMLRPVPPGGAVAAGAGTGAAAGRALVRGGAVVAASGSVLLLCFTIKAVVDGKQTPLDIADRFYGTHFGDLSNEREASPKECIGLEPAAVWESHGVEERLLDAFMGRPNDSLVRMWKELEE